MEEGVLGGVAFTGSNDLLEADLPTRQVVTV